MSSVCLALSSAFELPVYKELVKQNLCEPCFFVECVLPKRTRYLNNRFLRQHAFCIHYFPSSSDFREECNSVYEKMVAVLEYINVDGNLVCGNNLVCSFVDAKNIRSEFSHSVMKVTVDFDFFTYEYDDDFEFMGELFCY